MSTPAQNLERPMTPDELIDYVGRQYQVPAGLRHGLFKRESGENPNIHPSPQGALGLGQLMPGTARQIGVNANDPVENVVGSMHYLRSLYEQARPHSSDDSEAWAKAVAGYFSGPGNIGTRPGQVFVEDKADGDGTRTSQYVAGVLSNWAAFQGSDNDWASTVPTRDRGPNTYTADAIPFGSYATPTALDADSAQTQPAIGAYRTGLNEKGRSQVSVTRYTSGRAEIKPQVSTVTVTPQMTAADISLAAHRDLASKVGLPPDLADEYAREIVGHQAGQDGFFSQDESGFVEKARRLGKADVEISDPNELSILQRYLSKAQGIQFEPSMGADPNPAYQPSVALGAIGAAFGHRDPAQMAEPFVDMGGLKADPRVSVFIRSLQQEVADDAKHLASNVAAIPSNLLYGEPIKDIDPFGWRQTIEQNRQAIQRAYEMTGGPETTGEKILKGLAKTPIGLVKIVALAKVVGGFPRAMALLSAAESLDKGGGQAAFEGYKSFLLGKSFDLTNELDAKTADIAQGTVGFLDAKLSGASTEDAINAGVNQFALGHVMHSAARPESESTVPTRESSDRARLEQRADAFESTVPERPQTWEQRVEGLDVPVRTIEGIRVVKHHSNFQPRAEDGTFIEGKPNLPESTVPQRETQIESTERRSTERTPDTDLAYFSEAFKDKGGQITKSRGQYILQLGGDTVKVPESEFTSKAREMLIREGIIEKTAGRRNGDTDGLEGQTVEGGEAQVERPGADAKVSVEGEAGAGEKQPHEMTQDEFLANYERAGVDEPPRRSKVPDVDFEAQDLQDTAKHVTEDSIRKDYAEGRKDVDVYQSYIPIEDLPSAKLAEAEDPESGGYDWSALQGKHRGVPPIKVRVDAEGKLHILDGNHRLEYYENSGYEYIPAWVVDEDGHRASIVQALKEGKSVPPDVLKDYPDLSVGGTPVKGEEGAKVKQPHEMTREEIKSRGRQLANEKEPWEMSRDEFDVYSRADFYPDMGVHSGNEILAQYDKYGRVDGERRWVIERALEQGKAVPPEVLKDYPDLSASTTRAEATPQVSGGSTKATSSGLGETPLGGGPSESTVPTRGDVQSKTTTFGNYEGLADNFFNEIQRRGYTTERDAMKAEGLIQSATEGKPDAGLVKAALDKALESNFPAKSSVPSRADASSSQGGFLAFGDIYDTIKRVSERVHDYITVEPTPALKRAGVATEAREHVAARQSVPYVVNDLLAKVFPDSYADPERMARTIDVLNKDDILGGYATFYENEASARANGREAEADKWHERMEAIGTPADLAILDAEVQAALRDPEIVANVNRWQQYVNPVLDRLYNEMKRVDPDFQREGRGLHFGARINLLPETRAEEMKNFSDARRPMPEGVSANYRNPNVKQDPFMRAATFTGKYSTDAQAVLTNVLGPRLNEVTKLRFYDALVKKGVAVEQKYGDEPPTEIQGKSVTRLPIRVPETDENGKTRIVERSLYVRSDLAYETEDVLNTDKPLPNHPVARFLTNIQLAQLTDITAHLKNVHTVLASAPATRDAWRDAVRRLPVLGSVDAVGRITSVARDVASDTPAMRAELAGMARLGLLRPDYPSTGIQKITRGQQLIHTVDTASRVVMNRFFNNLVEGGRVKDTPENRAAFVQQIGEYNRRLMGPLMKAAKDSGFSPFIVAGRTFNRQAVRLLTGNPGVEASNLGEAAKMRAVNIVSGLTAATVLPAILNAVTVGSFGGRTGTQIGQWDLGMDEDEQGRHKVIDLFQLLGIRRGLRATGANALIEGLREGKTWNQIAGDAASDVTTTIVHPWMGPALGFGFTTLTGKRLDLRGGPQPPEAYNVGGGIKQYGENARVALKGQNPLLYGILSPLFTDPGTDADSYPKRILKGLGKGPTSAGGVADVYPKTAAEEMMSDILGRRHEGQPSQDEATHSLTKYGFVQRRRNGVPFEKMKDEVDKAIKSGELTLRDGRDIIKAELTSKFQSKFERLGVEDAVKVYQVMTPEQQDSTFLTLMQKRESLPGLLPEQRDRLQVLLDVIEQLHNLRGAIDAGKAH